MIIAIDRLKLTLTCKKASLLHLVGCTSYFHISEKVLNKPVTLKLKTLYHLNRVTIVTLNES